MNHPRENDLALLAGGEAGRGQRFLLDRHVRVCADCQDKIAEYRELRVRLREHEPPDVNWNFLAADMRANIRLGLEAGACVRSTRVMPGWNLRFGIALASLLLLVGSGFLVRDMLPQRVQLNTVADTAAPVLRLTGSEVEIRSGARSLALLSHQGAAATNRAVSARGDIETRYVDRETGAVTINNVSLQ